MISMGEKSKEAFEKLKRAVMISMGEKSKEAFEKLNHLLLSVPSL